MKRVTPDQLHEFITKLHGRRTLSPTTGEYEMIVSLDTLWRAISRLPAPPQDSKTRGIGTYTNSHHVSRGGVGNGSGYPQEFKDKVKAEMNSPLANRSAIARKYDISIKTAHRWAKEKE